MKLDKRSEGRKRLNRLIKPILIAVIVVVVLLVLAKVFNLQSYLEKWSEGEGTFAGIASFIKGRGWLTSIAATGFIAGLAWLLEIESEEERRYK